MPDLCSVSGASKKTGKRVGLSSVKIAKNGCPCSKIDRYLTWLAPAKAWDVEALTTQHSGFDVQQPLVNQIRVPMSAITEALGTVLIK